MVTALKQIGKSKDPHLIRPKVSHGQGISPENVQGSHLYGLKLCPLIPQLTACIDFHYDPAVGQFLYLVRKVVQHLGIDIILRIHLPGL